MERIDAELVTYQNAVAGTEPTVGDCGKAGRKIGATECSNIGARKGTYDAFKLEKLDKSQAVRSYADVTREDVQTPLGKNRLIITSFVYSIKVYLHW